MHVVVDYGIYLVIADLEEYVAVFLPYPLHLALESVLKIDTVQLKPSLFVDTHIADVVIATCPDDILGTSEYRRDTGDAWGVYNAPVGVVVVEQSLKVGHIYRSVVTCDDIEVMVMCMIAGCGEVLDVGNALRSSMAGE